MNQQLLNYEFYFLFQVEYDDPQKPWREPLSLTVKDNLHSIRIDEDKRLFRYAPKDKTGKPALNEWKQHLQQGWAQVQACYQDTFQPQAFMGLALLILDESVAKHQIQCNTTEGTVTFKPSTTKTSSEKILLKVTDGLGELIDTLEPVTLEEFTPEYKPATYQHNWQIQLSANQQIQLIPMQLGENYPNPIFAVYGLAHSNLPPEAANQLQDFLCGNSQVTLMWHILPRLLMQKWQFKRLDIAAYQLRRELDSKNRFYQQIPDSYLECASNQKLELDLRAMTQMDAVAKQVLARVDAGNKTLEINRYNLERHLQRSKQIWQELDNTPTDKKYEWIVEWQNGTETPLLDSFDLNIRKLQNHTTYTQDALAYLDGIRTLWQLHLDGRRLQYESNIQVTVLVLTFIAAFAAVVALIIQYPEDVAFLFQVFSDHPEAIAQIGRILLIGISFLILIIFVLKFSYLSLKSLWKKFRCWL